MKSFRMFFITLALLTVIPALLFASTSYYAFLDGAHETPPNASPGYGEGAFTLNNTQDTLWYDIYWTGLVGGPTTAGHFHFAPAGVAGPVQSPLPAAGQTEVHGYWAIDATNVARLVAGSIYVNIHNATFPGGEVRGQLLEGLLPVELTSFTAIAGNASVSLAWSTASETNNDHFEIIRNGQTMTTVSATNSPTGSTYNWVDNQVVNGTAYAYTLVSVDIHGTREELRTVNATPSGNSSVAVTEYALLQNYPNPFNPSTEIVYDIKDAGKVSLKVYNTLGQVVATLVNGQVTEGRHSVFFNGESFSAGLYFYKLETRGFSSERKMLLIK